MSPRMTRPMAIIAMGLCMALAIASASGGGPLPTSKPAERSSVESNPLPTGSGNGPLDLGGWGQMLAALAIIVALLLGLYWVLRRVGAAKRLGGVSGPIDVLARRSISPKQHLLLVRMGRRVLLIGSAPSGLTSLGEVTDPSEVAELTGSGPKASAPGEDEPAESGGSS